MGIDITIEDAERVLVSEIGVVNRDELLEFLRCQTKEPIVVFHNHRDDYYTLKSPDVFEKVTVYYDIKASRKTSVQRVGKVLNGDVIRQYKEVFSD